MRLFQFILSNCNKLPSTSKVLNFIIQGQKLGLETIIAIKADYETEIRVYLGKLWSYKCCLKALSLLKTAHFVKGEFAQKIAFLFVLLCTEKWQMSQAVMKVCPFSDKAVELSYF